jgi:hypothetical protein
VSRTLTASPTAPRTPRTRDVDCAEVVAGFWITLGEVWRPGRRYGDVQRNLRKVSKRLADPRLFDHPLRPGHVVKVWTPEQAQAFLTATSEHRMRPVHAGAVNGNAARGIARAQVGGC